MIGLLCFVLAALASPFKSKIRLEAENAALRDQLIVLRRNLRARVKLANSDRWFFIQLYRWFPLILKVLTVIRPETLVRWHRTGFRSYWRWKSRSLGGRPQIDSDLRALIRRMSVENSLWGAPRIHGELLKLGFAVAQYSFVIIRLDRRDLVWINVTTNPTAEWVARQITEAFPWDGAPGYIRGVSLGWGSGLYDPGSRSDLRCSRHTPIARHGDPGQAYRTSFALAEWLCRTADRIDPARVFGPHHCLGRGTSAPDSEKLCGLLQ